MRARLLGIVLVLGLLVAPSVARAFYSSFTEMDMMVRVGETASLDVGYAMGMICDDLAVVRPEIRGETPRSNTFYVTGVRPGHTLCRVGIYRGRPTFLLHIAVVR